MRTEPSDWFNPGSGRAPRHAQPDSASEAAAPTTSAQAAPATPYSQPPSYGQATAYGSATPYAPPPPPAPQYYAPLPQVPPVPPAPQYYAPLPQVPPAPPAAPAPTHPVRQPTGEYPAHPARHPTGEYPTQAMLPVRQPTGEFPTQRPFPPPPPSRRHPTGAYPTVRTPGRGRGGGNGNGPGSGGPGNGGHGHSHGTPAPASRRTARIVAYILIPCALATIVAVGLLWPDRRPNPAPADTGQLRAYGQVLQVTERACLPEEQDPFDRSMPCGEAVVHVTEGPDAGTNVTADLPRGQGAPRLAVGDDIVLAYIFDPAGGAGEWAIIDQQRGKDLWIMVALCAIAIIAFGRLRGLTALIGLVVSFAVLLFFIIPAILDGKSPLPVAIAGAALIMFAVLYLTHGFTVHTSVAVLGTLLALVVTGLLGLFFTLTTSLTGYSDETTFYLSMFNGGIDMRGLLLAGIIIGALGVLDDVTVTQATAVAELARGATSRLQLYRSAIRVGRAHVASAVNTLILAYAGASLPLLLLIAASGQDVSDLLSGEFLAQEIVRAAVGTIGLVAAVPITTALATLVADIRSHRGEDRPEPRHEPRPEPRPDGRGRPEPDHWAAGVTGR